MNYPSHLKYTRDHEWILLDKDSNALVGVTAYAVEQLGDIVHIDLPKVGDKLESGAPFGTIESTKTVSDLYSPVSGTVAEVNESIKSSLESLTADPYEKCWLVKLKPSNKGEIDSLMTAADYQNHIGA